MRRIGGLLTVLIISQLIGHPSKSVVRGVLETVSAETEGDKGILFQLSHFSFWYRQTTVEGEDEFGDTTQGMDRYLTTDLSLGFGYSVNEYFSFALKGEVMGDVYITSNDIVRSITPDLSYEHEPDRVSLGLSNVSIFLKGAYPLFNGRLTLGVLPSIGFPVSEDVFQERSDTNEFFWIYRGGYFRRFVPKKTFYSIMSLLTWRPEERIALHTNFGYYGPKFGDRSERLIFNLATEFYLPGASPFFELHAERFIDEIYGKGLSWGSFGLRFGKKTGATFALAVSTFLSGKGESHFSLTSLPPWKPQFGIEMSFDYISVPKPKKPPTPPPKEGIIAGKVVDEETGKPLVALVKITIDTLVLEMPTDTLTGMYKFLNVPEGVHGMIAESEGYEKLSATVLVKGGETTLQDFALKREKIPLGILTGRVIDKKTKEPLFAKLSFIETEIGPFFTDSSTGIYRVEVKPGTYGVKVEAEDYISQAKVILIKEDTPVIQDFELLKRGMRLIFQNIYFNSGKATLKLESFPILDSIAMMLKDNPDVIVEIQGHTDSRGSESFNLKLSEKRAETVKEYLVKNHGILPDRLITKGYGESKPIASNETEEGRAKNRRVEFVILGKKP